MSEVANDNHAPIPVTVLTGFLGAGKTTLLKYLLQAEHGMKIAVIENEYSETPIDGQLLGVEPVQVMTLSNGCVCCSINTDLEKALFLLLERRDNGEIDFDRLVIECTGLADPAPVAQTFFADEELCQRYVLDGIITLVDAANAERHLQETIAQAQVGFADRILVSKTDLVDAATFEALGQRLQRINRRALVHVVEHGRIDLAHLLDVRGFNLNADLGPGIGPAPAASGGSQGQPRSHRHPGTAQRHAARSRKAERVHGRPVAVAWQFPAALQGRAEHRRRAASPGVPGRAATLRLRLG